MTIKMKNFIWGIVFLSVGCSTSEENSVGISSDRDDLKKSACPCGEIFYQNGIFIK